MSVDKHNYDYVAELNAMSSLCVCVVYKRLLYDQTHRNIGSL